MTEFLDECLEEWLRELLQTSPKFHEKKNTLEICAGSLKLFQEKKNAWKISRKIPVEICEKILKYSLENVCRSCRRNIARTPQEIFQKINEGIPGRIPDDTSEGILGRFSRTSSEKICTQNP